MRLLADQMHVDDLNDTLITRTIPQGVKHGRQTPDHRLASLTTHATELDAEAEVDIPPPLSAARLLRPMEVVLHQGTKPLDPSFKMRPRGFFCVGRVFLVPWSETVGETGTCWKGKAFHPSRFEDILTHTKVRWYVVTQTFYSHCLAIPIRTFGGQGVSKSGVTKSNFGIIYSGDSPPEQLFAEKASRGEDPMRQLPVRVTPDASTTHLRPTSRVDYSYTTSIEKNLKVANFGMVHPHFLDHFLNQWQIVSFPSRGLELALPNRECDLEQPRFSPLPPRPPVMQQSTLGSRQGPNPRARITLKSVKPRSTLTAISTPNRAPVHPGTSRIRFPPRSHAGSKWGPHQIRSSTHTTSAPPNRERPELTDRDLVN